MKMLLDNYMDLFEPWFQSLTPYCVGTWGKYIKLDKDTMDKWTFDQAMILFEVESLKNIMAFTRLVVNGKDYFVRASIVDIVRSEARIRIDHAGEDTSEEDLSE
ncbi:hypothetical protein POUND7_015152 [Theobroma cacao]